MNPHDTAEVPSQVMTREMGDETVILDLASGTYFSLNPVGTRFWQLAREGRTFAQACEAIEGEYEVERDQLEADLHRLAHDLVERGLLVLRAASA
ncbi:MAG: PqqD family protein [Hydrogenophaga sp.]|nr:PqqD family protein [Hydrogenophaga sp.]